MRVRRSHREGFSLVEVVLALAVFATVGVALIGLLGVGIDVSHDALTDAEVAMLVENVQARLTLDPTWPPLGAGAPGKAATLHYDNAGAPVTDQAMASFRVTLTLLDGPGFRSAYFDTFHVAIERPAQANLVATAQLQRARLAQGSPIAAK